MISCPDERYATYNRYSDRSKFITVPHLLQLNKGEVYISKEEDFGIVVAPDDDNAWASESLFEGWRPAIARVARHICELDNTVLRFFRKKRIKEGEQDDETDKFPFDLAVIYLHDTEGLLIQLDYWSTLDCGQLDALFEYRDGHFFLRSCGPFFNIPDDWETE